MTGPEEVSSGPVDERSTILVVDDEASTLKYVAKILGPDLHCLTAASASEARRIIEREGDRIAVVLTDQRMPGETGVEFLAWLRSCRPQVVRILTTAYADLDAAIAAINAGEVYHFLLKPWDPRHLRGILLRAVEHFGLVRERDQLLKEKLETLRRQIVADRAQALGAVSAALAGRVRNPLRALRAFLASAPERGPAEREEGHVQWADLWTLAMAESQRVLNLLQEVVDTTAVRSGRDFALGVDPVMIAEDSLAPLRDLLPGGVQVERSHQNVLITADPVLLGRMLTSLGLRLAEPDLGGRSLRATFVASIPVFGEPGIRIMLHVDAEDWSREQMEALAGGLAQGRALGPGSLLLAYVVAYHHGGNVHLIAKGPEGPGVAIDLPIDPDRLQRPSGERGWMDRILTHPTG